MIIRKIDDLGRITIPKDIRKELELQSGAEIEIELLNKVIYLKPHKDKSITEVYIENGNIYDTLGNIIGKVCQ